jgi:uncharacterized membrane protein
MKSHALIGGGLIAGCFVLTAAVYGRLPDPTPLRFDLSGHARALVAKPIGPFVNPLVALASYVVVALTLRATRDHALRAHRIMPIAVAAFWVFRNALTLRAALGEVSDLARITLCGTSLFLVVVGNYLGQIRRNWWVGIRTPWTLADAEVWRRTHRIGGWLFVLAGTASFLAAFAGAPASVVGVPVLAAAAVAVSYSYVVYRRLRAVRSS